MTVLAGSYVDWGSMWKILVISIVAGAGLVAVYSVGLLALSASGYLRGADPGSAQQTSAQQTSAQQTSAQQAPVRHNVAALVAAALCLAIVAAGAVYGIHEIFAKG